MIRFSNAVEISPDAAWRVTLFRILPSGFLQPAADVEMADESTARLWAVAEARRRGRGHRAVGFRPDGTRAFSEGD